MSVIEVLQACRQHGTRLASRDGKLLLAGTQPSPALREALARHKAEILAWLEEASGDARARAPGPASLVDADEQGAWPLSYAQQRLWFIDQLDGASAQYNIPAAFRLTGALDLPAMQRALERVIERHEVLRTRFELTDGVPAQAVAGTTPLDIPMHDLSGMAADARDAEVRRRVAEEAARPFDLARDPMLRCTVLKLGAEEHVVLFTMHHIASDGWSQGVLVREFTALYAAFNTGEADPLPPLPLQYRHFARWQREAIEGGSLAPSLAYWQSHLAGMPVVHELPLDHPRPERQSHAARQLGRRLDIARLDALKALAQAQGATLFMVLQSAFAAVLSRWSGQDDVVIGVPSAGRERPEVAPLIGFFINTLVFRQQIAPAMTGEAIIQAGKRVALDAFTHAEIPFDLLNDTLKHPRSLAYNPLCQVKFVLQNHESGQLTLPGLQLEALDGGGEQVHFDLDLSAQESTEGLYLGWTYKASLFEASSIERMARAYEALLSQWLERPQARLDELEWVDAAQSASLRALGRGADSRAGRAQPLPRALEAAAARTPDAPAVRCGGVTLDHRELDAKANRLAHALLEAGVQAGDRVGVHLERSVELMVALLACMKAGAAYVPLDHRQPPARLQAIVADAGIAVVLVDGGRSVLPVAGLDTLYMDGAGRSPDWLSEYPSSAPAVGVTDADSAYVLYTSGSTGVPKGVEISHGGLMDYCAFAREGYYGDGLGGSLVVTSPAFDLSVPSLYVPLLAGGCVELMPAEDEVAALAARLDEAGVPASLLRMTPSHVQALLAHRGEAVSACAHVFVVGGEAFGAGLARSLQA
ncbi:condensation domain-containing protein, partial [Marilutibacter spongiae]